jgi:hypothetical protein
MLLGRFGELMGELGCRICDLMYGNYADNFRYLMNEGNFRNWLD